MRLDTINPVRIPKPTISKIGNAEIFNLTSSEIENITVPYAKTNNINDPEIPGNSIALEANIPAIKYLIIRLKDKDNVSPGVYHRYLERVITTKMTMPASTIK